MIGGLIPAGTGLVHISDDDIIKKAIEPLPDTDILK